MKKIWARLAAVLVGSVGISALALVLPVYSGDRAQLSLYVLVSLLHIGVAVMYLAGLQGFKLQFKAGYRFMSAAMVVYAIGILESPFLVLSQSTEDGFLLSDGWYYLQIAPFLLYVGLFYIGVRKLAKIIDVKSWALSVPIVLTTVCILGIIPLFIALPEVSTTTNPISINVLIGIIGAGLTLVIATMVLLFHLRRGASALYKPAFAWNFYGFLVFFIMQLLDPTTFLPAEHWYVKYGSVLPFLLSVACFVKAAFEYNRIPYNEGQLQTRPTDGRRQTSVDVIVAVAQLVSNPRAVDLELDKMRAITSKITDNAQLTTDQQTQLADVYTFLEDYLTQKEPAREYTRQGLRQLVELKFKGAVNEPAFWQRITASTAAPPQPAAPLSNVPNSNNPTVPPPAIGNQATV